MKAFATSTTVDSDGKIQVSDVPFASGTEVEVTVNQKRLSPDAFRAAWERICRELRAQPGVGNLTDAEIQREIDDYRAGR